MNSILPLNRLSRRRLLEVLAAGAVIAPLVGACSENVATGRQQLVLVSDEMLAQLSEQAWRDLQRQTPRVGDTRVQQRLEAIGRGVADASGLTNVNWEFVAFESHEVNAFVLPGGKVGFFRGLIELAASDGEIAAVMGHEVGHVAARHAAERLSQQLIVSAGVQAAQVVLSEEMGEHADEAAAALGLGLMYGVVLPYSRAHELEADRLGVDVMRNAGYSPHDAVSFWRRMSADSIGGGQTLAWLSTHPTNDERLRVLEQLAST
ncbi:MAG: M48 family metallopeptidase [Hyphomonadaceae bacterium]|nr:M48 family metallopeptidase [Hyphomonadaceae bacterium]